jgi:hypothetical protein
MGDLPMHWENGRMMATLTWNDELLRQERQVEDEIVARLMLRTGGRLRSLRVGTVGNRLCVWGSAPTYHVRQLAEQAALSLMPASRLQLEIEVVPALQWHERAAADEEFQTGAIWSEMPR